MVAYDATQDPAACRVLLHALLAGAEVGSDDAAASGFHLRDAAGL